MRLSSAGAAGRFAESRWRHERRARFCLLALAFLLSGAAIVSAAAWATWAGVPGRAKGRGHWLFGAAAVVSASGAACAFVAAWLRRDPGRWARGAAGERATAELLERLPLQRWAVLHDLKVPASRANIDHLAIGPSGLGPSGRPTGARCGWSRLVGCSSD